MFTFAYEMHGYLAYNLISFFLEYCMYFRLKGGTGRILCIVYEVTMTHIVHILQLHGMFIFLSIFS